MKKKQTKFLPFFVICILLLSGALVGYFVAKMGIHNTTAFLKSIRIALLLSLIPIFFIAIGVHEAGHVLAGSWVNFNCKLYVVGPFMWNKEEAGWKFNWNKNLNVAGGMAVCLPSGSNDLSKRFSIYAAGGPVASLLLSIVAYLLSRIIAGYEVPGKELLQFISSLFMLIALMSAFIFILTAVPMHVGGFSSDGARVLRLQRGGDAARFEVLILKIITGSCSGIRPKLLNMEDLLEAETLAKKIDAPNGVYLHSYFYQAAFDRNDIEKAEIHLQNFIAEAHQIPESIRNIVWLDACFFYAFAKRDHEQALAYWQKFKASAFVSKAQIFATEAALGYVNNERDLVLLKIKNSLRELPGMMDKGVAIALEEKLLTLKKMINNV